MRLENKVVVVTGASSGMGHAIATLFVNEGAKVVAVARRKERLDALAESLKNAPGTILPFVGDISDPAQNDAKGHTGHNDLIHSPPSGTAASRYHRT